MNAFVPPFRLTDSGRFARPLFQTRPETPRQMSGCVAAGIMSPDGRELDESSLVLTMGASLAEVRLFCGRELQNSNRWHSINAVLRQKVYRP